MAKRPKNWGINKRYIFWEIREGKYVSSEWFAEDKKEAREKILKHFGISRLPNGSSIKYGGY